MRRLLQVCISFEFLLLTAFSSHAICEDITSDEVARMISDLGSDDIHVRKAATTLLKQQGLPALPAVKQAARSKDAEVSHRCLSILRHWLRTDDRTTSQAADRALKELESSGNHHIRNVATSYRRDAPENVIKRLERVGARFTYRPDKKVSSVDMSRQGVDNRDVASLHSFREVEMIDLDYTEVTSDALTTFQSFSELRELRMRRCCLHDSHLQALQPLTGLKVLNLWRTGISDRGLEHLAGLTALRELNLGYNQITDDGLKNLSRMTELTTLNLVKCDITDSGLEQLAALPALKHLNVKGTRVTLSGIQHLQQERPELEIRYCRDQIGACLDCDKNRLKPLRPVDLETSDRFE